jgi:peptide/nickel transport system substrate-binding protein
VLIYPDGRLRFVEVQWRPDLQKPKALSDRRVREALYRSIDRQSLADAIIPTGAQGADSWLLPNDPLRATVFKGTIPTYSFDRAASVRLLQQAGFRRGADGIMANPAAGERFETLVWNTNGGGNEKENSIVADSLRSVGIAAEQYILPASLLDDSAARASFPGISISARTVTAEFENAQLRYREPTRTAPLGAPRGGYNNTEVNDLVDRLQITIPDDERAQITRQIMERVLRDLQLMPLYWNVETLTIRKGVTGPEGRTGRYNQYPLATWNVYAWDTNR